MPTDNKKIGAYLPDVVFDRFTQFQKEHNLSASKAVIQIFTDYFGINLNPTISTESTGELLGRVATLEKEISDLKQSYVSLFKTVDLMKSTSEPLISKPVEVFVDKDIDSELDSKLQSGLPKEDIIEQLINTSIVDKSESSSDSGLPISEPVKVSVDKDIDSELDSSLQGELHTGDIVEQPIDVNIIDESDSSLNSEPLIVKPLEISVDKKIDGKPDSSLQEELPLKLNLEPSNKTISGLNGSVDELFRTLPIDTKFGSLKTSELAKRFNLSDAMVHKIKKFDINKQILYTTSKDPDKRSWVYLESAKLFYPLKISE